MSWILQFGDVTVNQSSRFWHTHTHTCIHFAPVALARPTATASARVQSGTCRDLKTCWSSAIKFLVSEQCRTHVWAIRKQRISTNLVKQVGSESVHEPSVIRRCLRLSCRFYFLIRRELSWNTKVMEPISGARSPARSLLRFCQRSRGYSFSFLRTRDSRRLSKDRCADRQICVHWVRRFPTSDVDAPRQLRDKRGDFWPYAIKIDCDCACAYSVSFTPIDR